MRSYYGYPGNSVKPSQFTPDRDECRPNEIETWETALRQELAGEEWDDPKKPLTLSDGTYIGLRYTGSAWGIGTIEYDERSDE